MEFTDVRVLRDIALIRAVLGGDVTRVAVFGSVLWQREEAGDVDVLVEVSPGAEEEIRRQILRLPLSAPVKSIDIQTYDSLHEEVGEGVVYHFVVCAVGGMRAFLNEVSRRGGQYVFLGPVRDLTTACSGWR